MAKFPEPPPAAELAKIAVDQAVVDAGTLLWRIYYAGGDHPVQWNSFRAFGPTTSRFDHHTEPPHEQDRRILYAAARFHTCFAEVFQETRTIDCRRHDPWLVAFRPVRDIPLLDLSGKWPTRAHASMAINSGPRPRARRWSRAIYDAYSKVEGLRYSSSMDGNRAAYAFYERAETALPAAPSFHRALRDPGIAHVVDQAADEFSFFVVGR